MALNREFQVAIDFHQNKKFRSFKSKESIHKSLNEDGVDCTVSNNRYSSVTLIN